jgi:hypothetical protein
MLEIPEEEIRVDVFNNGDPQALYVRMTHLPTGIVITEGPGRMSSMKLAAIVRLTTAVSKATEPEPDVLALQRAVSDARQALQAALTAACPGPHSFYAHYDSRLPWCDACRRNAIGDEID